MCIRDRYTALQGLPGIAHTQDSSRDESFACGFESGFAQGPALSKPAIDFHDSCPCPPKTDLLPVSEAASSDCSDAAGAMLSRNPYTAYPSKMSTCIDFWCSRNGSPNCVFQPSGNTGVREDLGFWPVSYTHLSARYSAPTSTAHPSKVLPSC